MLGIRGLIAVAIAVIGVAATFFASEALRDEARQSWQLEATKTAGSLSGTLLNWLEESYAPISGLAALVENSDNVTESEFLNGFDSLEARATAFFLEAAALAEPAVEKEGDWSIRYSTDFEGALSPETPLADHPEVLEAIRAAKDRFGEIILARPIKSSRTGATVSPVALGTFSKTEELALVGLVDYRELVQGLYDLRAPEGAAVRISGRFPEQGGPGPERDIIAGRIDRPLFSVPTRTVSAGAELKITWDFDERFSNGPDQELANLTMISGLIGSAVLSLFLAFLLHQNKTIMMRVDAATRELSQKEAQLRLTLDYMPGGMGVTDTDLNLKLMNTGFAEFMGYPEDMTKPGVPHEAIIRYMAENGYFGEDADIEEEVENRMESVRNPTGQPISYDTPDGRSIELRRRKAPSGDVITFATDVTERKAAERELAAKEAQLRLALEHMPGAMWVVDKDLNLVFANDQYKAFYGDSGGIVRPGTPMEEIIRQEAKSGLLTGGEVDAVIEERMTSYRSSEPSSFEDRTQVGGHIQLSRRPATDGNVVSVAMDITELKESERQIEAQRAQLDEIMRNTHQGIVLFDKDQRLAAWNDRYCDVLNIDAAFFQPGMPLYDIARFVAARGDYGPGDPDQMARERVEKIWVGESRTDLSFGDGRVFDAHSVRTPDGGLIVTYTDITERRQWEDALKESEKQVRRVLEESPIAVAISVDDESDDDGIIQFSNRRFVEMLGFDPDDIGKARTEEFMPHGKDREDHEQRLDRGEALMDMEVEINRRGGEKLWTLMSISPIRFNHRQSALIWLYDISERKEAERQIEAQRAQLDNILRNIQQGVVLCDDERRIIAWNPRFPEFLNIDENLLKGGPQAEAITRHLAERGIYGEGDLDDLARQRTERLWQGDTRADLSFGDERSFEVHSTPLPDGGLIATYMDITERKNAERIIADAMKLINESIQYASRIQRSVLPSEEELKAVFADHLVVWEPKDVVGGDIYLIRKCLGGTLLFVADCTGHGVPGAFMTMIATGSFDQALIENPGGDPAELLKRTNQLVKATLGQQEGSAGESDDGLECGLCLIDHWQEKLTFAGARFELWVIEDGTMDLVKGDRSGIGYRHVPGDRGFSNRTVVLGEDTALYMFSDGITDQIGGPKRRSFGKRRMKSVLMDYHKMPMNKQVAHLMRELEDYQHDEERRDDMTLLGFVPMIVP